MGIFSRTHDAIGVLIDGPQVEVAHLRRKNGRIELMGLDRAALVHRLDVESESQNPDRAVEEGDPLGLEEELDYGSSGDDLLDAQDDEAKPETNVEVLYRLLGKFPLKRCRLALSLMETCVHFFHAPNPAGLKGRKLKRQLMEGAQEEHAFAGSIPPEERHAYIEPRDGQVLSIVQEDPLQILGILDELKPFLGKVQISLIDPLEVTLMNLVRLGYPPTSQVTATVYVGEEFSRVIFMQDGNYLSLSQTIHEGFGSPDILQTVYRRMLFEQDESGIPDVDTVVLCGECAAIEAQPFFQERFPDAKVDYLALPDLDLSQADERASELVPNFAVSIGLAWKALCPQEEQFYQTNFLPRTRRRQQNPLEVAWHGVLLLFLLATSTLLLGMKVQDQSRTIDRLALSVELLEERIREDNTYVSLVDNLHEQSEDYRRNFALIDTLLGRKVYWGSSLLGVATDARETGRVWLSDLSTTDGGIDLKRDWSSQALSPPASVSITGRSLSRDRIPLLAERLGMGHIGSTSRSKVRSATVYDFHIKAAAPNPGGGS